MGDQHDRDAFHSELKRHLEAIAVEEGLTNMTYATAPGSKTGDNYIGVVHRIAFSGERRDATETKSLIYKCQPDGEGRREYFRTEVFFRNEAQFYNEVLPVLDNFQREKRLPKEKLFSSVPTKCYYAGEVVILDDMRPHGFVMRDRRLTLDVKHCRLVMRELGKFHALSFALRDQKPEVFKMLSTVLEETLFLPTAQQNMDEHFETNAKNAVVKFEELYELVSPEKDMINRKIKEFQSEYYSNMLMAVNGDEAEPYAVLNHGDCWTNNILFKYDKQDSSTPVEICCIDYQMARYASPVTDIAYFIYCCTDHEVRKEHYDSLMEDYHNSLSVFLKELGSDPEKLFPFAAFKDQLHRFSKFGLGMAIMTIPLFTCNAEDLPDFDAVCEDESISAANKMAGVGTNADNETCWRRMNDIIVDMVDQGYIG